jgi:hypothetical protein
MGRGEGLPKLAAIVAIALSLGLAAAADAAPRSFFGTVAFEDPTAAEFDRMGRGKVGTFRANLYWAGVEPQGPGTRDWSRYDALIGRAASNGIRVLPTVYGSPPWAADQPHHPPKPQFLDEFEDFVAAVAKRYGPGGEFWTNPFLYPSSHFGRPVVPIVDLQIWNEVNSPQYWTERPHGRQYKPLLAAARRGLKGVNPGSRIVIAGLFRSAYQGRGVKMERYLRQLYRAGAGRLFDAVAVHPYALTPGRVLLTVKLARKTMRRFGDGGKPIWIDEVGWATSGKRTPVTVKRRKQARYLRQTFRLAARNRKRLRIAGVIWFSFKDTPSRLWIYRTGLFNAGFKPKPAWRSFVRLTGGRP